MSSPQLTPDQAEFILGLALPTFKTEHQTTKRVIEANGATTVTQEMPETGRTEITDPLGNKTAIQLDEAGHPAIVTGPGATNSSCRLPTSARTSSSRRWSITGSMRRSFGS